MIELEDVAGDEFSCTGYANLEAFKPDVRDWLAKCRLKIVEKSSSITVSPYEVTTKEEEDALVKLLIESP